MPGSRHDRLRVLPPAGSLRDNRAPARHRGLPHAPHAPAIFNKGLSENLLWDGRASTLEEQVYAIENPEEMALGVAAAMNRLGFDEEYDRFREVYGREVNSEDLAKALAAFVRAHGRRLRGQFRLGERGAHDEEAGLWIYEGKGGCWKCHNGPNFSDEDFHNTGVGAVDGAPARGRFKITGDESDRGRFRTPGLRMLTKTAPYMHDGSIETLEEVVEFYRRGGNANSNLSDRMRGLRLTDAEAGQLVAFLKALSR